MSYKIILDSCGELAEEMRNDPRFERVALTLIVGDYEVMDDDSFDQKTFLQKVKECVSCPRSACPSPEAFRQAGECDAERIYFITLSSHLSGSYNSACIAKGMLEEEYPGKKIAVFDSMSASIGQTQIARRIAAMENEGADFETIVEKVGNLRNRMKTYFVLDNLETLRKNGRMSRVTELIASTLNIKPVMGADMGVIIKLGQTIGTKKALNKMTEIMAEEFNSLKDVAEKSIMISHCNCAKRAEQVKNLVLEKFPNISVTILDTAGVSSMYACDGGIILTAMG